MNLVYIFGKKVHEFFRSNELYEKFLIEDLVTFFYIYFINLKNTMQLPFLMTENNNVHSNIQSRQFNTFKSLLILAKKKKFRLWSFRLLGL